MIESATTALRAFFDVDTVFFTVLEYPMSYIEFFGTVFTVWCVWLTARARILSWPVGIVGVVLYLALFYQIRLYADVFEQGYFLVASFVGWWLWRQPTKGGDARPVTSNTRASNALWAGGIVVATLLFAAVISRLHLWVPSAFPEPASYPFLDAFTTVLSFAAQALLAQKKVESWVLWIVVDVIGIWLYATKGVRFISLEYVLFLGIAVKGFLDWRRALT